MTAHRLPSESSMLHDAAKAEFLKLTPAFTGLTTLDGLLKARSHLRRVRTLLGELDLHLSAEVRRIKSEQSERRAA